MQARAAPPAARRGRNLGRGTGLAGIDRQRSDPLLPPWPELLITAGMRNEPVARWVREQSGGRTRLVHVGRPWADPARFDLVITTPQYRLPRRPNVLHNDLPLHRVHAERLAQAAARWAPTLAPLPAPRIAVVVGGNSGPTPWARVPPGGCWPKPRHWRGPRAARC